MISATVIVFLVLIVVAILGVAAWSVAHRQRTRELREHFGPEYEGTLARHSDRSSAEADLRTREDHIQGAPIRPLRPEEIEQLAARWHDLQADFVNNPKATVRKADELIEQTMRMRGYPAAPFEERAQDLSVDHPAAVRGYRAVHEIAVREGPAGETSRICGARCFTIGRFLKNYWR